MGNRYTHCSVCGAYMDARWYCPKCGGKGIKEKEPVKISMAPTRTKQTIIYNYLITETIYCPYCNNKEEFQVIKSNPYDIKIGTYKVNCNCCGGLANDSVSIEKKESIESQVITNSLQAVENKPVTITATNTQISPVNNYKKSSISGTAIVISLFLFWPLGLILGILKLMGK